MLAIISAMQEEIALVQQSLTGASSRATGGREFLTGQLHGTRVVAVFSHWGKVAAAATIAQLLSSWPVTELVFCGVAGGVRADLGIGDIVVASDLIQHDMDASPLFARYEIPLTGKTRFTADAGINARLVAAARRFVHEDLHASIDAVELREFNISQPRVASGLIASGDKFFSTGADLAGLRQRLPDTACVEMEGAAAAQVCEAFGVPYGVVRVISDGADDHAARDFPRFVRNVARHYSAGLLAHFVRGG